MTFFRNLLANTLLWLEPYLPPRRLIVVKGDSLPAKMPIRSLVLARDGREKTGAWVFDVHVAAAEPLNCL